MKVTLLKDVLTPDSGVGNVGQTVEMSASEGREYIKAGLAKEAADDAQVAPTPAKPAAKVLTQETLKEDKAAKDRKTKTDGPAETK